MYSCIVSLLCITPYLKKKRIFQGAAAVLYRDCVSINRELTMLLLLSLLLHPAMGEEI